MRYLVTCYHEIEVEAKNQIDAEAEALKELEANPIQLSDMMWEFEAKPEEEND